MGLNSSFLRAVVALLAATAASAQTPQGDSARVISVSPGIDEDLHDHQRVRFTATVRYSLKSSNRAMLAMYAERFENGPDGCDNILRHHTEGGARTWIQRGDGEFTVYFDWHESPGRLAPGPSFLAIGTNLWKSERAGGRVAQFEHSFCRPVTP
jgi:hypothetical protein